jgi:hypothetical protein
MISPLQFAGMFIDWTDPHKAVYAYLFHHNNELWSNHFCSDTDHHKADPLIHFDMASEVMRALLGDTLDSAYMFTFGYLLADAGARGLQEGVVSDSQQTVNSRQGR